MGPGGSPGVEFHGCQAGAPTHSGRGQRCVHWTWVSETQRLPQRSLRAAVALAFLTHHEGLSPGFCWRAAPQMPTCQRVHTWPGEGRCLPGGTSAGGLSSPWWESEKGYGVHLCEGRGARCNDDAAVITQKEEEKNRIKSEP